MKPILEGIRVADFSWAVVGGYGSMLLGLMGAEVIKIESIRRIDISRNPSHVSASYRVSGVTSYDNSPVFNNLALNKRSIRLNLQQPKAGELAKRLIEKSDVVVENFRPGFMARVGLDYASLKEIKPDIIMVSQSFEGQTGPESRYVGYAANFGALAGVSHLTGYPDHAPSELRTSMDFTGGFMTAFAALAGLNYRQKTGKGKHIDCSVVECLAQTIGDVIMDYTMNGRVQSRRGNLDDVMAPHNCYPCKEPDSWVSIAVATDEEWTALCHSMGMPELEHDARFCNALNRWKNQAELDKLIGKWTANFTPYEVTEVLQKRGVAAFPSMTSRDLFTDKHLKERGAFQELSHPILKKVTVLPRPFQLSATPLLIKSSAPLLGQDNAYVFSELLGLSAEEIAELEKQEIIY